MTSAPAIPAVRVLKIAVCPSLSGKSDLTYLLGCTPDGEIKLRICNNSAAGYFNDDWASLSRMQQLLVKASEQGKLTSFSLRALFKGKSINTPPFLFAALLNEKLVQTSTTTKRSYEITDGKKFFAQVKALEASKVDLTGKVPRPKKTSGASGTSGSAGKNKPDAAPVRTRRAAADKRQAASAKAGSVQPVRRGPGRPRKITP